MLRGLAGARARRRDSVVTIGSFDGLHIGHHALIARTIALARELGAAPLMVTFEPLPREFLQPDSPPPRLTNFRERWRVLAASGIGRLAVLRFDAALRSLSGAEFAALLARDFAARAVVVGHDFRFGRGGEASAAWLATEGPRFGFAVEIVPPVSVGAERVSSSAIRERLAGGEFEAAARLLGRPYTMSGRVTRGERVGRTLGFPTANVRLKRRHSPLAGIFAARVHGVAREPWPAVASLGTRPTFGGVEPWLEPHLFDFSGDLYGREIGVEFVAKIRDEARFESLDALIEAMRQDASAARRRLGI